MMSASDASRQCQRSARTIGCGDPGDRQRTATKFVGVTVLFADSVAGIRRLCGFPFESCGALFCVLPAAAECLVEGDEISPHLTGAVDATIGGTIECLFRAQELEHRDVAGIVPRVFQP